MIDAATRRNLELDVTLSGSRATHARRAARPHRHRHGQPPAAPLAEPAAARSRSAVGAASRRDRDAARRPRADEPLRDVLQGIGDIERILARVALQTARPRDLARAARLAGGAARLQAAWPPLRLAAARRRCSSGSAPTRDPSTCWRGRSSTTRRCCCATAACIAEGYDAELDELRALSQNADQFLLDLEQRERERTGIANLKVSYNRVHGYYIEISRGQSDEVPDDYRAARR